MDVTHKEIFEIIENAGVAADISQINNDTSLTDAGVDSLDMANVLLGIEEKYDIKIPDEDMDKLDSINAIVAYLAKK
ncbi:acyl carrier protein [Candidatus Parcubacteria bacterium]|nr:MAG: acyl carrier protein [Candidatus Parcubacteria bacterium]